MGQLEDGQSYELEPMPQAPPVQRRYTAPVLDLGNADHPCLNCGYNLRGLQPEGVCPECGVPIARSLQGNLLKFSSPEYVQTLHRGTVFILISVLASVAVVVLGIAVMVFNGPRRTGVDALLALPSLAVAALSLVGWWMFTAPDPAIIGNDRGDTPRKIIRMTVIVSAAATLINVIATVPTANSPALDALEAFSGLVSGLAGVASFFASLLYLVWLAPRFPDPKIKERSMRYLWLLPLIAILGACVIIGPLIAAIFYYLLINEVRLHLRQVLEDAKLEVALGPIKSA